MKALNIFFAVSIILILSVGYVSAMRIDFYYHPSCPHCQNVMPTIQTLMQKYITPCYEWRNFDTSQPVSYDIKGVPTIKIKTSDNRNIEISGDTPILKQLPCELQEMTTPECPTYPAESNHQGSWFVI